MEFAIPAVLQDGQQRRRVTLKNTGLKCRRRRNAQTSSGEAQGVHIDVATRQLFLHAFVVRHQNFHIAIDVVEGIRDFGLAQIVAVHDFSHDGFVDQPLHVVHRRDRSMHRDDAAAVHEVVQIYVSHAIADNGPIQDGVEEEELTDQPVAEQLEHRFGKAGTIDFRLPELRVFFLPKVKTMPLRKRDILRLEGGGPKNIVLRREYNRQARMRRLEGGAGKRKRQEEGGSSKKKAKKTEEIKWKPGRNLGPCVECASDEDNRACRFRTKDECDEWRDSPPVHPERDPRRILEVAVQNDRRGLIDLQGVIDYNDPNNRELLLAELTRNGQLLQTLNTELRADSVVILAAVSNEGFALQFASEELKNNRNIVMTAVSEDGQALQFASEELQNDYNIVMVAVSNVGWALEDASETLQNNYDIVLSAVSNEGNALQYASEELQANYNLVMTAVSNDGKALQFASENLQNNYNIVMAAVSNDWGYALEYASEELQNNPNIVMAAVSNDGYALQYASEELQNNYNIVMAAVSDDGEALEFASEVLQDHDMIVFVAVSNDGNALEYASEELQNNYNIVRTAVSQNRDALQFASEDLRQTWRDVTYR
ncbi:MAG: hypothetical protein CMF52_00025 [Legionellales bacterium]|nr:hypothetical protein [Legionellales bacterium]